MKKGLPLLMLLPLVLAGCAAPADGAPGRTYRQVTMEQAVEMMAQETNYIILDVRTEAEYAAGHIPNALLVPNETIDTQEISLLPDKNQLIMVYCRSGNRSKQAAQKLVRLGYTNVVEFGGINSWPGEFAFD